MPGNLLLCFLAFLHNGLFGQKYEFDRLKQMNLYKLVQKV